MKHFCNIIRAIAAISQQLLKKIAFMQQMCYTEKNRRLNVKQLGEQLRKFRQDQNLSLNDVYQKTGVHDSVLSHIENGDTQSPAPGTLKKLADLYGVSVISLYLLCGYINENDLIQYQRCFSGADLLIDEEKDFIQKQIDILTRTRRGESYDF